MDKLPWIKPRFHKFRYDKLCNWTPEGIAAVMREMKLVLDHRR